MTVKELIKELQKMPLENEVNIEVKVDGVEFDTPVEEVYESGNIYLYGDFGKSDYIVK